MAQLTDLRDDVRTRLGLSSDDGKATDAVVTDFINAALRQISIQLNWEWLYAQETITTVAAQASDTPDATWISSVAMNYKGSQVRYVSPSAFPRWQARKSARPEVYTVMGKAVHWGPTPNAAYDIVHTFVSTETTLSDDTDEPDMPDWAIDYLIVTAAHILAGRLGDFDRQRSIEPEMNRLYNSLLDESRRSREPVRTERRRDHGLYG